MKYKTCSETANMNSNCGTFQQPHENSKKRKEPYMRTFPSLMKKIKSIGSVSAPKEVVSKVQVIAGGAFNLSSDSEVARNRTQVYNALRNISRPKSRNTRYPKSTDYHKLQMLLVAAFIAAFTHVEYVEDISHIMI